MLVSSMNLAAPEPIKTAVPHQYLTVAEVAELLRVSVKTIYRMASSDSSMPATRVGGSVRFRADLLASWLLARTQRTRRRIQHQSGDPGSAGTSTAA